MRAERTTAPGGVPRPPSRLRGRCPRPSAVVALVAVAVSLAAMLVGGGSASADPSSTDWQRLRQCESGNDYTANTGNGYYGAYQFDQATWRSVGGTGLPHQASVATQDALALKLWQQRGWTPWVCASIIGLDGSGGGGGDDAADAPATGALDAVTRTGLSATVAGWVLDPTRPSTASQVHVYVSSPGQDQKGYAFTTDLTRPDVNQALGVTGRHGFSVQVPLRSGPNTLCVFAIGAGGNTLVECRSMTAAPAPPRGVVDSVVADGLTARVTGWAFDPGAATSSVPVHVYVDDVGYAFTANRSRPDVNAAFGLTGQHGFGVDIPLRRGRNPVCTFAVGSAAAGNTLVDCRDVESSEDPLGSIDEIQVIGGSARVRGWTFDPATTASTQVHVYVNGAGYAFRADDERPDVNAVFRTSGSHGFSETVPLRPGRNQVCVFGIGRPGNPSNLLIGCRDVQNGSAARSGVAVQEAPTTGADPGTTGTTATSPSPVLTSVAPPATTGSVTTPTAAPTTTPTSTQTGAPTTTSAGAPAPTTTGGSR